MNAIRGAAKGERERLIAQAHLGEVMARQKVLKPLAHYLKPVRTKPVDEGAELLAAMKRMKARQDKKEG